MTSQVVLELAVDTCIELVLTGLVTWNPEQYQRFGDERSRPFFELVDRIQLEQASHVVDLGCGPGNLTASLMERWPDAHIVGVDNDANMLSAAEKLAEPRLTFVSGTIEGWRPPARVDVMISNAAYQWVPGHLTLLPELLEHVRPGGWFAFQVPGNLDDPHHQAIRALIKTPRWQELPGVAALPARTHDSHTTAEYVAKLAPLCDHVDAWDTTYVHILQGENPVLEWVKGTALRPVLAAINDPTLAAQFCDELGQRLAESYPSEEWGTPFPFKRNFVVVRRLQ